MSVKQGLIIGLCGGSGSGKSSLADLLRARRPEHSIVLRQDWYYRDCSHLSAAEVARYNFDHPAAIDLAAFTMDLQRLRAGHTIQPPDYCFQTHRRRPGQQSITATNTIIAEGLFLYNNDALNALYDIKIFIHADSELRLQRRIQRDVAQRGRSLASVTAQYLESVKPMHDKHVEPNRRHADRVIAPNSLAQLATDADTIARDIQLIAAQLRA